MDVKDPVSTEKRCVICQKPAQKPYLPFCSKRCADVDLKRWLNEDYVIADDGPGFDEEPPHN